MLENSIEDIGKYYIYRHIRLDKNEPFYIGKGTKLYGKNPYSRAYTKTRNSIWTNIVQKSPYGIEILLESNNLKFILEKEKELIKLYGRIKDGGTLANILKEDYSIQHEALAKNKLKRVQQNQLILDTLTNKVIKNFENYSINNGGQVISLNNKKIITWNYNKYKSTKVPYVWLSNNKGHTSKPVRLLVAQTFIPNSENKPEVINIDGNLQNNNINNLKWVTVKERITHNRKFGYDFQPSGENHYKSKLSNSESNEIKYIAKHLNITHQELGNIYNVKRHVITHLLSKIK